MTPPVKVDPAALEAAGHELAAVCADLRAALGTLAGAAADAGPATGGQGAPEAYGQMWTAWQRDLTGVDNTDAGQTAGALSTVERSVDAGRPVPVLIGDGVPRHYVLVVGHHDGDLQIYEPTSGRTVTVTEDDFRTGSPAFAQAVGYPNVQAVVTPDSP